MTGDVRSGKEIADEIRAHQNELGITASVGVSFNKVFAKMGSDYKKPDATTVITRENFRTLLCRCRCPSCCLWAMRHSES